jgi:3'(2'), 5'-bisphosphate nucleotidase
MFDTEKEGNYLLAIRATLEAGQEIMKVYNSDNFQVEIKADNSPLTQADRAAHNKIMEYLQQTSIPVLSEEGRTIPWDERKQWRQLWIVDPLDGTKEFIKRNGDFTVNIALVQDGIPIFGLVYLPVEKTLYMGLKDKGAFKIKNITTFESISVDEWEKTAIRLPDYQGNRPFSVVASLSHMSPETQEFIDELKIKHHDLQLFSRGSSLKLCAVAEGSADVYPRFAPTMEWDTAAGQALVEAAGGKVLQVNGEPLTYNRKDLLNPFFIALLKES